MLELFIDGTNLIHKLYHALPSVDAVEPKLRSWVDLLNRTYRPHFLRIALDAPGGTWRSELFPDYKGQRSEKPDELRDLLERAEEMLGEWFVVRVAGHEADDLIATWARRAAMHSSESKALIVSADKDLFQCLRHDQVSILRGFRSYQGAILDCDWMTYSAFVQRYQFTPPAWPMYRALVGDKSDNLPGVSGIGDKYAQQILAKYATLDDCVAAILRFQTTGLPAKVEKALVRAHQDGSLAKSIRANTLTTNVPSTAGAITQGALS